MAPSVSAPLEGGARGSTLGREKMNLQQIVKDCCSTSFEMMPHPLPHSPSLWQGLVPDHTSSPPTLTMHSPLPPHLVGASTTLGGHLRQEGNDWSAEEPVSVPPVHLCIRVMATLAPEMRNSTVERLLAVAASWRGIRALSEGEGAVLL